MTDKITEPINWGDYGLYHHSNELANVDWVPVASHESGGGYDWIDFHAFWSPSARRYFWDGDAGCSCNSWGDNLYRLSDFRVGNKAALQRAFREFADEHYLSAGDALRTADEIARFKTGEPR